MQCVNVIYCAELCRKSLLYTAGGLGLPLAGLGQSAGGGEAPGSTEQICILQYQKRGQKNLCGAFFSVLNTIIKICQIQLSH